MDSSFILDESKILRFRRELDMSINGGLFEILFTVSFWNFLFCLIFMRIEFAI